MSGQGSGSAPKRPKNPLLFGADMGFPFDNLQGSAILMPIAQEDISEPIADASKPPASILPSDPAPPPASTLPSAAAPLFSLFKQALGGLTDPTPLLPQPVAAEPASEVPLYAPTAAPILVPLFDPKTLEVNGNEPTHDEINGNTAGLAEPAPPPPSVSFFDPSRFQSSIDSLRGASSPAQFTQQPPPDLPAPTPKSETTPSNQTNPVFTTAPSHGPSNMSVSTSMPPEMGVASSGESQSPLTKATTPPQSDQGYSDYNSQQVYGNQQYYQNQNVEQWQYNSYYGQQEQQQQFYQPPQFYDPAQYNYSQNQVADPQRNDPPPQQTFNQNQEQTPQFFNPADQSSPSQSVDEARRESVPNEAAEVPKQDFYPPPQNLDQNQEMAPQFFNPNQFNQNQTVETVRRESVLNEPPQQETFDQNKNQTPQFFNPNQFDQTVEPPRRESVTNEPPQQETAPHQTLDQTQPPQFFNPNQFNQNQTVETLRRDSEPNEPPQQEAAPHQTSDQTQPPPQFFNPNQFDQNQTAEPPRSESVQSENAGPPRQDVHAPSLPQPTFYQNQEQQQPQFFNPGQFSQNLSVERPRRESAPRGNFTPQQEAMYKEQPFPNSQQSAQFFDPSRFASEPNRRDSQPGQFGHDQEQPPQFFNSGQFNQDQPRKESVSSVVSEKSLSRKGSQIQSPASYFATEPVKNEEPAPRDEPTNLQTWPAQEGQFDQNQTQFYNPNQNIQSPFAEPPRRESMPPEAEIPLTPQEDELLNQQFSRELEQQASAFFNPNRFGENRQPTPPEQQFPSQLDSSFSELNLHDQQRSSPHQSEASIPEPEPFNVYNIPQNTSIFNTIPSDSQPQFSAPPVSSTPLSTYFSQKHDSRPSSVASTRSQLASFFDRQDTPTSSVSQPSFFNQSAADFFDAPQPIAPPQQTHAPPPTQFFNPQAPQPAATSFFSPPQAVVEPAPVLQNPQEPEIPNPPAPERKTSLNQFFSPPAASPPPTANIPPPHQPFSAPQQPEVLHSVPLQPAAENSMVKFFTPPPVSSQSDTFPPATQFFAPQQAPNIPPVAQTPPAADPVVQTLPPAAFQAPLPSAPSPPIAISPEPSVQLFNPGALNQGQKPGGPPVGDGNKFRIKSALNKYALPPSLANPAQNYFAPAASFPVAAPSCPTPPSAAPSPPGPTPATFFNVGTQPQTPSASSFFTPAPLMQNFSQNAPSQDASRPPTMPGMMNPLPTQFLNPAENGKFSEISEEAVGQALLSSAPATSISTDPPSIPVTVSQILPSYPGLMNPYSNSTAQKQQPYQQQQHPSFFTPASAHDGPVIPSENFASGPPLPPQKSAMSGGNNYRLGNSRPQYAQVPGLGSSVSAIASMAASMAMSSPLPSSSTEPHDGFAPIPSIAIGATHVTESTSAQSLPADSSSAVYKPVTPHWFFEKKVEKKAIWSPFSFADSEALENAFRTGDKTTIIQTDGGRYDVNVHERKRMPIYWDQAPNEVRRCSWFYKNPLDSRSLPYEENFASKLEEEYMTAHTYNRWPRRIELSFGEAIVFSGPNVMSHVPPTSGSILEDWGTIQDTGAKSRIVRRGCDEFDIDEGESGKPDHLLFLVHGIGSVCDLKFRTVVEVVDDFRSLALTLVRSHFRQAGDDGRVSRVEVLPVSWHGALHGEETGIDKQLQNITLKSIPRLRHFTNDTLLDILFYTSPVYCQTIIQTVGHEINRLQQLFMQRNPDFNGGISLGGHSLGSLILFDLLCHQKPTPKVPEPEEPIFQTDGIDQDETGKMMPPPTLIRRDSCKIDYMMGHAGTGQPQIHYPQLHFNPMSFFALGSPVGMFVTVRGIESLGLDFALPTCPAIFNIFHPFDPVAYRIEALVNPELAKLRPVVIPHHKGRKRMHIELRETMARVSTDLKEKLVDSVKSTWNTVYSLAMFNRGETLEQEVDKVLAEQMMATDALVEDQYPDGMEVPEPDPSLLGKLNSGRRVDYVLQEAPLESFNEYLFALGSHVCYWESEDTMLMMLKEIYTMLGVNPDRQFDRTRENSMVRDAPMRERSWSAGSKGSKESHSPSSSFLSPTTSFPAHPPMGGPPPTSGFVRK